MAKRIVRISESQLDKVIKNVLKEQEDQFMSDVDQSKMSDGPEETSEPNFDEFIGCAQALLTQGVIIGALVDKLIEGEESQEGETEPEVEENPEVPVQPQA